ncbi:MAG: sugar transferase [Chloroflexi bacterium]|nr:MAG: sugar transferase [Chloroflexota bacterium]
MSIRANSEVLNAGFKDAPLKLKRLLVPDLQGFQAPFSERKTLLMVMDALLIFGATWGAIRLLGQTSDDVVNTAIVATYWYWFPLLISAWWGVAWFNDLYHIPSAHDANLSAKRVLTAGVLGLLMSYLAWWVFQVQVSQLISIYFFALAVPAIALWRYAYTLLSNIYRPFSHRILILGQGKRGQAIAQVLQQERHLNYTVLGYLADCDGGEASESDAGRHLGGLPVLGKAADLLRLVREQRVHQVVVAIERSLETDLFHLLVECQANGVAVVWMPDLFEKVCRKIPIEHIDPAWGLHAMQEKPIFSRLQQSAKRLCDLLLCVLAFPAFLLILPLLALAIRLDSPGSIFYRQIRCGRGGKPFAIFKFRTMVVNAEQNGEARWASKDDARITRVGRFLRKTRLDELPQVLNILSGEMSFVGPRPERPEFVAKLEQEIPFYRTRLTVKPGLTGWAQINYEYGNSVEDARTKLEYDFYYVRYWSLWLDLYILFRTVSTVIQFKGT